MPEGPAYVIIGASLAGAKAAETLREDGFGGPIVLLGTETERPYERPPLSKGYLLGQADKASLYVHDEHWYSGHQVDLRLGVTAVAIDRAAHRVDLDNGEAVGYERLLLTPGSHPRVLQVPGGRPRRGALPAHRGRLRGAGHRAGPDPRRGDPRGHRRRGLDRPGGRRRSPGERRHGDGAGAGAHPAAPAGRPRAGPAVRGPAPRARGGVPARGQRPRVARPTRAGSPRC